ncbi:MAG: AAA family ATPase [Maricaulaceae bacterium]
MAKTFSPPPVSDAPPEPPVQSLHTVSAASFAGKKIPKQQWLARDLIPAGQPCLLSGDGGLGKSLLALQLTVAVASDTSWLSRVVAKGGALYLSAEDELDEIHRRLAAICKHASLDLAKLTDLHIAPLAEVDALLAAPQAGRLAMTALYDALVRRVEELRPAVVVLDSLADVFGGNEIVRPEVRWFVGQLRGLCHRTGCTIVILAHPSLSGMASGSGLSGSTHWNNSVRSRLYLTRPDGEDDDPDERVLEVKKNNRGALGKRIDIRWQRGVFVACDGGDAKAFTDADVDALFLEILARYAEEGRYVNAAAGASYAPTVFAREEEAAAKHVKKKALAAAMRRLFKAKRIVVQTRRVSGHDRSFIALAGGSPQ